jgi:uncharacterized protein YigE (DUF2233 family)
MLSGCGPVAPFPATITPEPTRTNTPIPSPQVLPTTAPANALGTPQPNIAYDNVWRTIKPGLDIILITGRVDKRDELLAVTRIDPNQHRIRVLYDPIAQRDVRSWYDWSGVDVAINAGFFLDTYETAALLIQDGQTFGRSYQGFGGMFAMRGSQPSIQWLKTQPYQPDTTINDGVQSFPTLVLAGKVTQGINDNGARDRRSFVAIDRNGLVLLGTSQTASWTLTELARFLAGARILNVSNALNLDGGPSTGMWVRGNVDPVLINSLSPVPSVIVVGGG